jgi:hypothetical protein
LDYNCYVDTNGDVIAVPFSSNASSELPVKGQHDIEVDPLFIDADGGNFTPQNPEVIYGGMPDINGNESAIGAVQASVNNNELYKGNINSQYGKNNKQYGPE